MAAPLMTGVILGTPCARCGQLLTAVAFATVLPPQGLQAARAAAARGESAVFIGDLNAGPEASPDNYKMILDAGFRDAYLVRRRFLRLLSPAAPGVLSPTVFPTCCVLCVPGCSFPVRPSLSLSLWRCLATPLPMQHFASEGHAAQRSACRELAIQDLVVRWMNMCAAQEAQAAGKLTDGPAFTWDPANYLNTIGPHSSCPGQRCDHLFIPTSAAPEVRPQHTSIKNDSAAAA